MHTAISATPLISGRKEPVDAILVHAGQLLLGGPHSSVTAYTLPDKSPAQQEEAKPRAVPPSSTTSSASKARKEEPRLAWTVRLAKSVKTLDQLHVIREANLLVSLCDAQVCLHDLATIIETGRSQSSGNTPTTPLASAALIPAAATTPLVQTKGAMSLALDTSIQRGPAAEEASGSAGWGAGYRHRAGRNIAGRAYRPSDATLGRGVGASAAASLRGASRPLSLLGMDDIRRNKEQQRRHMTTGARQLVGQDGVADENTGIMSVVTTLVAGCRRKLIVFRWVDGAFWDTKVKKHKENSRDQSRPVEASTNHCSPLCSLQEVALPHTPRTLAFPTPMTVFMGYSSAEYATLSIPLAAASSVADLLKSDLSGPSATIPTSSAAGSRVDLYEWKLSPVSIPLKSTIADSSEEGGSGGSAPTSQAPAGTANAANQGGGMAAMAGAFSGLGGYIGMASKSQPLVLQIEGSEVLVCRESMGVFLDEDGKPTRREGIEWPAAPEEVIFVKPYVFAILPPSYRQTPAYPLLQVRSAGTLLAVQTLPFPPLVENAAGNTPLPSVGNAPSVKLLTPSANGKPPLYVKVTPTERNALEKDGLSIWCLEMKSWGKQIDELVAAGEFQEALALLHSVDEVILEDKTARKAYIETLYAVSLFLSERFDEAIEHFIELDTNPARVIVLYPTYISGPLARERCDWMRVFGAKELHAKDDVQSDSSKPSSVKSPIGQVGSLPKDISDTASVRSLRSTTGHGTPRDRSKLAGLWGRRPQSVVATEAENATPAASPSKDTPLKDAAQKGSTLSTGRSDPTDSDTVVESQEDKGKGVDAKSEKKAMPTGPSTDAERKAIDALGRFLADRRRIFKPILETQPSSHSITLSQTRRDPEWLLALPSEALNSLDTEQLTAVAQTVDTALFKTFLATKPGLLGPLCRVENWCEVDQVEELLLDRKRFSELISLYGGKEMHDKALQLLRKMSDDEDDAEEKVGPTIRYLQNLGPEHIGVILEASHWVLSIDPVLGMEIFCADTGKVAVLPRHDIVADLENFDEALCIRYMDHLIRVHGESDPSLHEKLAFLLLRRAENLTKQTEERTQTINELLTHLGGSQQYRAERVLHRVPTNDKSFYDVRALLYGRLGQDEAALRIYVDRLHDHGKAEEYCKQIVAADPASSVFLTLLQIYLRPKKTEPVTTLPGKVGDDDTAYAGTESPGQQLEPALAIIRRHGRRLNARAAFELLPPKVRLSSVDTFATKTLRQTYTQRAESLVLANLARERALQIDEEQAALHRRRVKVTESRTCPRCMKRLGNSVIAVTARGAVLHYSCSRLNAG